MRQALLRALLRAHTHAAGVRAAGGGQPAADEPGRRFMAWFTKLGGTTRSIELAAFPGSGRGVRATRPLTRGTVVAEIPMDIVVTLSTVAYDPSLRDLGPLILTPKMAAQLGHTDIDPNAHQQLARPKTDAFSVWVAMQRKRGKDSPGEPWVGLFPTDDAIGDPLAWPPHAQAWLQASPLRKKLQHKNEMLAETVTVLRRELGAQWLNYTLDDHRWGFTNVQRRNYMVQTRTRPWAGPTCSACLRSPTCK